MSKAIEVRLSDHVIENIHTYRTMVKDELSRRAAWEDPAFGKDFTPRERQEYYHAYRAGKWGRRLVGWMRRVGLIHRMHEHGFCAACGGYNDPENPYMFVKGNVRGPEMLWTMFCSAHILGRIAMWHVLSYVKHTRRAERR